MQASDMSISDRYQPWEIQEEGRVAPSEQLELLRESGPDTLTVSVFSLACFVDA